MVKTGWIAWLVRHPWTVIIGWLFLVGLALPSAMQVSRHLTANGLDNPQSQAVWATNQLADFSHPPSPVSLVVSHVPNRQIPILTRSLRPGAQILYPLTRDPGYRVALSRSFTSVAAEHAWEIRVRAVGGTIQPLTDEAIGQVVTQDSTKTLALSGIVAAPVFLILLLAVFGSLAAVGLPFIIALAGSELALAAVSVIARYIPLSVFLTDVVSFLALGVGIDYALFISTRFRTELAEGKSVPEAVLRAMQHAGRSVFYSGLAVGIAVLGLSLGGNPYWRGLAVGGAVAIFAVLLATHSLLPAIMTVMGRKIHWGTVKHRFNTGFWHGWGRWASHYPWRAVGVGLLLLAPLAYFGPAMTMGSPANTAAMLPPSNVLRQAVTVEQRVNGAGSIAPLAVVLQFRPPLSRPAIWQSVARVTQKLRQEQDVATVSSLTGNGLSLPMIARMTAKETPTALRAFENPAHGMVVIYLTAASGPDSPQTSALIARITRGLPAWAPLAERAAVGGSVAYQNSFNQLTAGRLPWMIGSAVFVAFLVLAWATGSWVQAFLGVLLDGLVALATAGVLNLVVQHGAWGFQPAPVDSAITPLIFVLLFGLSMDYEVILLHRIQEHLKWGHSIRHAAWLGMAGTGAMITGAGMIMATAFLSLVISPLEIMKTLALGLAVAVILDTWVVRSLLVPGASVLLGRLAYWPWRPGPETKWAAGDPV